MNPDRNQWEQAETIFNQLIEGHAHEQSLEHTEIIKSVFNYGRNWLNGVLEDLLKEYLENPPEKKETEIKEQFVQEKKLEDTGIRFRIRLPEEERKYLLFDLLKGDQDVFNELYEDEFPKIVDFILRNSGTKEDARDIFQESLLVLIENVYKKDFKLTSSIGTYLYAISKHLWFEELRHKDKLIWLIRDGDYSDKNLTFNEVENQPLENYIKVEQAIESLSPNCIRLLTYYYTFNMHWQDIAWHLGYSDAASARNQKYKCLEKLRAMVKDLK